MTTRDDLVLELEAALIDWKGYAQPHELAELAELLLDAQESVDPAELEALEAQFRGLERFVESRKASVPRFSATRKP